MTDEPVRTSFSIIDRRKNPGQKSHGNVERFKRRYQKELEGKAQEAVDKLFKGGTLDEINAGNVKVKGKTKTTGEPRFVHDPKTGKHDNVLPGNKEFVPGDSIAKPKGGSGGSGKKGSADGEGEGEDEFEWILSREEYLKFLFKGMKLPNLVKTKLGLTTKPKHKNAGTFKGYNPSRLHMAKTLGNALGRRISLGAPRLDRAIAEVAEEIMMHGEPIGEAAMLRYLQHLQKPKPPKSAVVSPVGPDLVSIKDGESRMDALHRTLDELVLKRKLIQYIEPGLDPASRLSLPNPQPVINAVMFCLMDASASMGEKEKDIAKRFFALEYMFLQTKYPNVKVVFIRHTSDAKEVDEKEFFGSRETGGTVSSSAFKLMREIIKRDYGNDWNIYGSYAGDGGTFDDDIIPSRDALKDELLPDCQHFAYLEVQSDSSFAKDSNMMNAFKEINSPRLAIQAAKSAADVYPVFRKLFADNDNQANASSTSRRAKSALEL